MDAEREIVYFADSLQPHEEVSSVSIVENSDGDFNDQIAIGSEDAGSGNSNPQVETSEEGIDSIPSSEVETVETVLKENTDQEEMCPLDNDSAVHDQNIDDGTGVETVETVLEENTDQEMCPLDNDSAVHDQNMDDGTGVAGQDENPESSTTDSKHLTCQHCNKKFSKISNKMRHVRKAHKLFVNSASCIKCLECNLTFTQLYHLRDHLVKKHGLEMVEHQLSFPNMEAFQKWKCEIERKTLSSYTLRHGARKGPFGPRLFFSCHRSGKYFPKTKSPLGERKRILKTQGSCKMGILCTASISVHVTPKTVSVIFCPNHYGHGKDTTLIQLSAQEQTAIKESVAQGMSYEKLLDEIRDAQSSKDHFQLYLLKKKDIKGINNSFSCDDFNTSMSDGESIDHWVSVCCQMENSPVLYYRKEEHPNDKKQDEFILIIMTEHQKHILQTCDKNVICVDSLYRKKGGRFYLTVLFIMDETDLAFPVAYCISNKVDQNVVATFYQSLKEAAGELNCKFFMSDCEAFYYDTWKMIMNGNPRWLWSMWYVDSRFRIQLRVFRGKMPKRAEAYRTMRMLLECQNQTVFQCMLKNFAEKLKSDPEAKDLGNVVENHYAPNAEIWAYCYRKDIDLATNIHLEIMHRTFRYCCREGRKTRLDKFIFVIMKLVRDKMFGRLCSILDDDKIEIALSSINGFHKLGLEIPPENITVLSDKTWLVQIEDEEDNYYVTREYEKCPEHCNLKCADCNICVHMYICSCTDNLINANMCNHIHAVVWHLLTPHFTPPPSPVPLLDITTMEEPEAESTFFTSLLTRCHDVYKQIQANKTNLNTVALNSLMRRLNECVDVCTGRLVDEVEKDKMTQTDKPAPVNYQPPVYFFNSIPMTTSEQILPSTPAGNNSKALIFPSTSAGCNSQALILPSTSTGRNSQALILPSTSTGCNSQALIFPSTPAGRNSQALILPKSTSVTKRNHSLLPNPISTSNKPIQISNFPGMTTLQPIVPSNNLSSIRNNCPIQLTTSVPGTNLNHSFVISTAVPTNTSYRPILLPNITTAKGASVLSPSAVKSISSSTPLNAQNFISTKGANGVYYLLPSSAVQVKTEKK